MEPSDLRRGRGLRGAKGKGEGSRGTGEGLRGTGVGSTGIVGDLRIRRWGGRNLGQ